MRYLTIIAINGFLIVLVLAGAELIVQVDSWWPLTLPVALQPVGWLLLVAGSVPILAALHAFVRHGGGSGAVGHAPVTLVTTGVYRLTRNPIYMGTAVLLLANACVLRSPTWLCVFLAFLPAIHAFVTRIEEPRLRRRFGQSYVDYTQRVPRWLP